MAGRSRSSRGNVDVDMGVGLGGVFKGMGSLFDLVAKMAEEGREEAGRTGKVEGAGGKLQGVYGFHVRLGLAGKPVIERFGNLEETQSGTVVAETREPLVDVLDEGGRIVVIVELPGVEEKDVQVRVQGGMLEVTASAGERRYRKELALPSAVDPGSLEYSCRNGVLEVRLAKRSAGAP